MHEYEVEHIIGKRQGTKGLEYKVKWLGYPIDQNTWEPLENLDNAHSAIESFEANTSQSSKNIDSELEENFSKAKIKYTKKKKERQIESESESSVSEKPKQKILRKKIEKKRETDSENRSERKKTPTQERQKKIREGEKAKLKSKQKEPEKELERTKEKEKVKTKEKEGSKAKKREESAKKKVLIDNLSIEENQGSFKLKDLPKRIVHCQIEEKDGVKFEVEWRKTKNGEKPGNTMFFSKELRKYDPELIIDFYEARLSFVK